MQYATAYSKGGVWRNHIQAIRKDFHAFPSLLDRKSRPFGKDPLKDWHVPDRDAARTRMPCPYRPERAQEARKMIQATCRSAYSNDRKGHRLFASVCCAWYILGRSGDSVEDLSSGEGRRKHESGSFQGASTSKKRAHRRNPLSSGQRPIGLSSTSNQCWSNRRRVAAADGGLCKQSRNTNKQL